MARAPGADVCVCQHYRDGHVRRGSCCAPLCRCAGFVARAVAAGRRRYHQRPSR